MKSLYLTFEDPTFAQLKTAKTAAENKAGHRLGWKEYFLNLAGVKTQ